jgi:hypothetical protein
MKELIDSQKLDFYLKMGRNVLLEGKHGVGKTMAPIAAFERAGVNYRYFSAATCDPFIDFVGVPRVVEENGKTVLKLIRQEHLEDESIEVIFLDEYNRAPKKMKNAVMELIQFKSVNGKKFPNLKAVWASINPDDSSGTYDVEPLDPAQYDRFHVHLKVDYRPCPVYLENKYGSRMAAAALEWWGALTATMKDTVSPRRLCYALDFYLEDGDIRDILPEDTNVSRLIELLVTKPIDVLVQEIYDSKDAHETKAFINNENNLMKALEIIKSKPEYQDYFFPNLNNERASSLLSDEQVRKNILSNISNFPNYEDLIKGVLQANANKALVEEITIDYLKNDIRVESIDHIINKSVNTDASCYTAENDVPISKALTALSVEYNIGNLTPAQGKGGYQAKLDKQVKERVEFAKSLGKDVKIQDKETKAVIKKHEDTKEKAQGRLDEIDAQIAKQTKLNTPEAKAQIKLLEAERYKAMKERDDASGEIGKIDKNPLLTKTAEQIYGERLEKEKGVFAGSQTLWSCLCLLAAVLFQAQQLLVW